MALDTGNENAEARATGGDTDEVRGQIDDLLAGRLTTVSGTPTRVLSVAGSPRSGKTTLCYDTFVSPANAGRVRAGASFLIVSHRRTADSLSNKSVTAVGNSVVSRPVKTLVALAFDILKKDRQARGLTSPKLLDGAEQDQLIRSVLETHRDHVRSGDDATCETCALLKKYFSVRDEDLRERSSQIGGSSVERVVAAHTTASIFEQMMTPSFADQLRDMFARLSELHFHIDASDELSAIEDSLPLDSRRRVEWNLAVALRAEYAEKVRTHYPEEFRVDNAFVLVAAEDSAARIAREENAGNSLPELVIVDDAQELTLAGFSFLETLAAHGTSLLMARNNDESVQTFRGAYPEVLSELETAPKGMNARQTQLPHRMTRPDYRTNVVSRVSQAIGSVMVTSVPIPQRPGKLPAPRAAAEPAEVTGGTAERCAHGITPDASLQGRLFRSGAEELDDLVWQVKSTRLREGAAWRDFGVIAHDNATLQTIGKRFDAEGIPVSYSSVSRPLKEESVVQGLLALMRMVAIARTIEDRPLTQPDENDLMEYLKRVAESPLFVVPTAEGIDRPLRLQRIMAGLASLAVLEGIASTATQSDDDDENADLVDVRSFAQLRASWNTLHGDVEEGRVTTPLGVRGLCAVLMLGEKSARRGLVRMLDSILSRGYRSQKRVGNADLAAIARVGDAVERASRACESQRNARSEGSSADSTPHGDVYETLWNVWDACDVAEVWQTRALSNDAQGRAANRLLDTVIRLFTHASAASDSETVTDFIDRISHLEIEADSLAKVAPEEDAVTVASPAGASGSQWEYVWIPSLQQDLWPNLTPRNTLFGAEILADVVVRSRLTRMRGVADDSADVSMDARRTRLATLYSEMKSFLVALTRAGTHVSVSAVASDTMVPSEFLAAFLPEIFSTTTIGDAAVFTRVGGEGLSEDSVAETESVQEARGGLDMSPRGLVSLSRARLACYFAQPSENNQNNDGSEDADVKNLPPDVLDAAEALAYLSQRGVPGADPSEWGFAAIVADDGADTKSAEEPGNDAGAAEGRADAIPVMLSPSSVDSIWRCPLKWAMENKYNGPRSGNVATSFGTLIHGCAEEATQSGLDRTADVDALTEHMVSYFHELRDRQNLPSTPEDRYAVAQQDRKAESVLKTIATYFVESRSPFYGIDTQAKKPAKNELPPAGALEGVESEKPFTATFSLRDIVPMVAVALDRDSEGSEEGQSNDHALASEVAAALTALADGFDADFSERAVITLSGRIDRLEHRNRKGEKTLTVVDYKTGNRHRGPAIFADLQLVCYQLGLMFTPDRSQSARVERSVLFDVEASSVPSPSYGGAVEGSYQPALFESGSAFNVRFTPRPGVPQLSSIFSDTATYAAAFEAFDRLEVAAHGNETLMWCLTMISRIFYAAGYRQADRFVPKRGATCTFCAFKSICPAWPEESGSIYGATVPHTDSRSGEQGGVAR